jgi:hypothetical protein
MPCCSVDCAFLRLSLVWLVCGLTGKVQCRSLQGHIVDNSTTATNAFAANDIVNLIFWASRRSDAFASDTVNALKAQDSWDSFYLQSFDLDWRPIFVICLGETLGYIVRGVTGEKPSC